MEFEYFGSLRKYAVFNMWIKLVVFSTKNWSVFDTNCPDFRMNASAAMLSMMIPIIRGFISGLDIRTSTTSEKGLPKGIFSENRGTLNPPTSIIPLMKMNFPRKEN